MKKLILIFTALLFLSVTGYFYKSNAFTLKFVDEQYNFAIGKYLLKGEVLYDDIITNHQPITHIFSAFVQKYSKPNTTFLLVNRHRIAIVVWSIIWSLFLVYYFGIGALLFVFLYELTKSYLFGNLFLAETLVVYPLLFLVGLVIYNKRILNRFELIFSGVSISLCVFLLGPILPAIGFLTILLLHQQKKYLAKTVLYVSMGMLPIILIIWNYTSFPGYFHYYLYTNLQVTVPNYHGNESWIVTILKAFLSPILEFTTFNSTPTLWIIRAFSLLLIVNLIYFILKKKFILVLIITALLGLSNIRFVSPESGHYSGFHILPWFSVLTFIASAISIQQLKQNIPPIFKKINLVLIIFAIIISLKFALPLFLEKVDLQKDYLINYSTHTDRGEIISIMHAPTDTLFVSSDAWLVYWQADTNHLDKLFGYYTWMSGVPKLHEAVLEVFRKNPPTFFYCDNCKGIDLEKFLDKYIQIVKSGVKTDLYVLPYRIQGLSESQLKQLKFYNVTFN